MPFAFFLFMLVSSHAQEELPVLRPGDVIRGRIEDSDPVVSTDTLDVDYTEAPTVGRRYLIRVCDTGTYTVDMKSILFDAYLILRDKEGKVLMEDNDGLYWTHSRILFQSKSESEIYFLDACALRGELGDYELSLVSGRSKALSASEKNAAALRDARDKVRIIEDREGKENPTLAKALNGLANLLKAQGKYEEAYPTYERALGIREQFLGPEHPDTALSLDNLAAMLHTQGKYEEAKPLYERARSIRERILGPEHPDTVSCFNNLAALLYDQGKYEEAKPLYERVLSIRERILGPEHSLTALSLNNLAALHYAQGNYKEAKPLLKRAVEISEKVNGPEHPDTAINLNNLAGLLNTQGKYKEAEPLHERALSIRERVLGPEHPDTANSLNNLAVLLVAQGKYKEAKPLYERAFGIFERVLGPEHPRTAATLNNLAVLLESQGKYDEAKPLYERAFGIRKKALGPEHPLTASSLNSLALLLHHQGNYEEAIPLYEKALGICEKVLGPEHPDTALTLDNLAGALEAQGNYEKARPLYERALRIREKVLGPDHPHTALNLNNLALLLHHQGNYEEAKPLYERALGIQEEVLGPEHPQTAASLDNLAGMLKAQGNYEEAKPFFERALGIREKVLGLEHPRTALSLGSYAKLLSDLGEVKEAWELTQRAVNSREAQLERILWSLSEHDRLLYGAKECWFLEIMISLGRMTSSADKERTAYEALLRWKGRVSRSLLQSRVSLTEKLTPQTKEIISQLKRIQSQLSKELFTQEIKDRKIHEARLSRLRKERKELEEHLVRYVGRSVEKTQVDIRDIGAALPASSSIVDFYIHRWYAPAKWREGVVVQKGTWSQPHLSAWILCQGTDKLLHVDIGPAQPIQKAATAFLEALVPYRGITFARIEESSLVEERHDVLRRFLWDPIAEHVEDVNTIFLSPDGFLATLPFEILQLKDGSFLIEHHAFVYLQDMASLAQIVDQKDEAEAIPRLLAVGGVDYTKYGNLAWREREEPEEYFLDESDAHGLLAHADVERSFASRGWWQSLPATLQEARAVAELHEDAFGSADSQALLLHGSQASEERLRCEFPRNNIIHLATHGFFQPEGLPSMWEQARNEAGQMEMMMLPEMKRLTGMLPGYLSGLVLAGANNPPEEGRDDGYLTAEELTWLNLSNVGLVVLSACETGLGSPRGGEGMIGLRRSLRLAGVDTVISSLWSVKDESTSELMQNFYHRLWIQKQGKLEALRGAQLDMLKKNRIEHGHGMPSTWGAFVLDGDWW